MTDPEPLSTGIAVLTMVTGVAGLALVVIQHRWNGRRSRFDNTIKLIDRMESVEMLGRRHDLEELAASHGGVISYARLAAEPDAVKKAHLKATCSIVCKLFGLAGFMCRRREADGKIIIAGWARTIIVAHDRLAAYMDERDRLEGGIGFADDFHWLNAQAKAFAAAYQKAAQRKA